MVIINYVHILLEVSEHFVIFTLIDVNTDYDVIVDVYYKVLTVPENSYVMFDPLFE